MTRARPEAPKAADRIVSPKRRQRDLTLRNVREDARLVIDGKLDMRSALGSYRRLRASRVELVCRDAQGALKWVRRGHNLRTTMGRDQLQRLQMFGDVGTGSLNGLAGTATASSATTLTDSGAAFPTATSAAGNAGLQGHVVVVGPNASGTGSQVFGVIVSNTATVLTVDQWYVIPCTGAAGTTPNATGKYTVLPGGSWTAWIGLSTSTAAAAAGDVLRTADGLFGDGTTSGTATEQSTNGLARAYVACTYPSASNTQFAHTWTYSGSSSVTLAKVVLTNSAAVAGSLLLLETLLNATGTVTANGDTLAVTWTVTL